MTRLEELKSAYFDAVADAAEAAEAEDEAYEAYRTAADAAYEAELKKTQEELR